ncbi:MAG TPA: hypothetical protein VIJ79_17695 [Acidobacteriaceae bacterium]
MTGTAAACRLALTQGLQRSAAAQVNEKGYVKTTAENLVEGVYPEDFEADLREGDGNELESKFRAAYSSSALAINTFAPFKTKPADLRLPSGSGFTELRFERKCPHGLVGRRPPNLDVS